MKKVKVNNEVLCVEPDGNLFNIVQHYDSNNYRKMHHLPMIKRDKKVRIKAFKLS